MPAIQPARLRHQAVEISQAYRQPDIFIKRVNHVLSLYTDRTHKSGQSGEPKPLMLAYNVPPPVIRQIMAELKPVIQSYPKETLALCDLLWKQPYWELRFLAASILGQYQAHDYKPVFEKLNSWLANGIEDQMIDMILEKATYQLRLDRSDLLLVWVTGYLSSNKKSAANISLRMLTVLAREGKAENLPTIFKQINPLLRVVPKILRQDLLSLVSELARRSPGETAFVLRKNLNTADSPDTAWIIRQVLSAFPDDYQENLRAALRQQGML